MIEAGEGSVRVARLQSWLTERGYAAAVLSSFESVAWVTGVAIHTQKSIPRRLGFVVVHPQGLVTLVCNIEAPLVKRYSWVSDVRQYVEFAQSPTAALADLLEELGLQQGALAYEEWHLMASPMADLRERLPKVTWVGAHDEIGLHRAVKSPREIELLQVAARRTELALVDAFAATRAGESQKTLAGRLFHVLKDQGAEEIAFLTCAVGTNTTIPHAPSTDEPLQPGQVIKVDFGGLFEGYYSDIARMGVVGEPSPEQRERYHRLIAAHRWVIERIQPGLTAAEVFELARQAFIAHDLPFTMPHYGHGLGIELHEGPMLAPTDHTPLAPGMVLCLEPRATLAPAERYHVEDLVLVTDIGCRLLSDAYPTDEMVVIPTL